MNTELQNDNRLKKMNTTLQKVPNRQNIITNYTKNKEIETVPKQAKKKINILQPTPYRYKQGQV